MTILMLAFNKRSQLVEVAEKLNVKQTTFIAFVFDKMEAGTFGIPIVRVEIEKLTVSRYKL